MKAYYASKYFILIMLFIISQSCLKEQNTPIEDSQLKGIMASLDSSFVLTKTQHTYLSKKLKTVWQEKDEILIYDGVYKYKFIQQGNITNNGNNAYFVCEEGTPGPAGYYRDIIAVYPYSTDLEYNLEEQTGRIDDLKYTDILIGHSEKNTAFGSLGHFHFSPLCVILKFPKDMLVAKENQSGSGELILSGENICNKIKFYSGLTDERYFRTESGSEIKITANISNGKLKEDLYVCFIPRSQTDRHIYYLKTIVNNSVSKYYEFFKDSISTTKIYNMKIPSQDNIIIEDKNFKAFCLTHFDCNRNNAISYSEAMCVTSIEIHSNDVKSLKGIEYFQNLNYLDIEYCPQLTSLDISKNTNLISLIINDTQITSLDISKNLELESLECYSDKIKTLDISKNTKLVDMTIGCSQLTTLDVSKNTSLTKLVCDYCQLTSLDVSKNTSLTELSCEYNQLTSLDVSKNLKLLYLRLQDNQLTVLDLSKNTELMELWCSGNQMNTLNISNNTEMIELLCAENQLTSLDVSKNTKLNRLDCFSNKITSLDVSKCAIIVNPWDEDLWLGAWPQESLDKLFIRKGQHITYSNSAGNIINPGDYGTTVIEL